MAKLPRRRTNHLTALVVAGAAALCASAQVEAAAGESVDLLGTWHVLVHYTDDHSHDPTQIRWDDKIWVFEASGSRLRWTEYPIVVFEDSAGRFENLGGSRAARVLHGWEPNAAQLAQIAAGLEVNPRGSKSKTLQKRGDDWHSAPQAITASASIISYVENWSVENASGNPTFRREDILGSATTENLDGVTEYVTTEVDSGGDVLRGTFERDGSRRGTFRLMRSGAAQAVKGSGKSEGQRFYEMFFGEEFGAAIMKGEGGVREAIERRAKQGGEVSDEMRQQVRAEIRAAIEQSIRDTGGEPGMYDREIDSLTRKIEKQVIDEGRSIEEIDEMIRDGQLDP